MKTASGIETIAFLGNYLPRKCGIATFTSDLLGAVALPEARLRLGPGWRINRRHAVPRSGAWRLLRRLDA